MEDDILETSTESTDTNTETPTSQPGGRLSIAEMLAEMDASQAPADEPDKKAEASDDESDETESDELADDELADDELADDESSDDESADGESDEADPETNKRLEALKRQERRNREQLELTRMEMFRELQAEKDRIEAHWQPQIEQANRVVDLFQRAQHDPTVLADELGWDADTQLEIAKYLWTDANDKKGDPKFKAAAENMRRDRQTRGKTSDLEKKIAELSNKLEQQEAERRIDAVAQKAASAVSDKTPVLKSLKPEYVSQRIRAATLYIRQQTGQDPDPADVVAKLEEVERQDLLDRIGPERFAALNLAAPKKNKTQQATEKKMAKTNPPKTSVSNLPPLKDKPSTQDLVRELEELERKQAARK